MDSMISAISKELDSYSNPQKAIEVTRYFRDAITTRGVMVPQARDVAKRHFPEAKVLGMEKTLEVSGKLLKTGFFEEGVVGITLAGRFRKEFGEKSFAVFDAWLGHVGNWAHCDFISSDLLASCIEKRPELAERLLEWTKSKNRWKRRSAAVTLVPHLRRGMHIDLAFRIADRLLEDSDDMVRKGVGWMLKEGTKSERKKDVVKFIRERKGRMPRLTLRYAIEKLDEKTRKELMGKG